METVTAHRQSLKLYLKGKLVALRNTHALEARVCSLCGKPIPARRTLLCAYACVAPGDKVYCLDCLEVREQVPEGALGRLRSMAEKSSWKEAELGLTVGAKETAQEAQERQRRHEQVEALIRLAYVEKCAGVYRLTQRSSVLLEAPASAELVTAGG